MERLRKNRPMQAISLVEKGWAGARGLSIALSRQGVCVRHLVRGRVPLEVLQVLTPYEGITIQGFSTRWYRWVVWGILLWNQRRARTRLVMVDNSKAMEWVRHWFPRLKDHLVQVEETPQGSLDTR